MTLGKFWDFPLPSSSKYRPSKAKSKTETATINLLHHITACSVLQPIPFMFMCKTAQMNEQGLGYWGQFSAPKGDSVIRSLAVFSKQYKIWSFPNKNGGSAWEVLVPPREGGSVLGIVSGIGRQCLAVFGFSAIKFRKISFFIAVFKKNAENLNAAWKDMPSDRMWFQTRVESIEHWNTGCLLSRLHYYLSPCSQSKKKQQGDRYHVGGGDCKEGGALKCHTVFSDFTTIG